MMNIDSIETLYFSKTQLREFLEQLDNTGDSTLAFPYSRGSNIITTDSPEAKDVDVFYKGKKISNVVSLQLYGANMKFKTQSWQERLRGTPK